MKVSIKLLAVENLVRGWNMCFDDDDAEIKAVDWIYNVGIWLWKMFPKHLTRTNCLAWFDELENISYGSLM